MLSWYAPIRGRIEQLCADNAVPIGVAVGWIQEESGGHLGEVTSLDERGYFQLMPSESQMLMVEHNRLSTDVDYSLSSGFRLVNYYKREVLGFKIAGLDDGTELHFRFTKLAHSLGGSATRVVCQDASKSSAVATWEDFSAYCSRHDSDYLTRLHHSPMKWIGMVDRVFETGRPYGLTLACQ